MYKVAKCILILKLVPIESGRHYDRQNIMIRLFFSFLIILSVTSCKVTQPKKANGIPDKAFWVGGKDGGQWYLIDSINKSAQTINCKIFNDYSGNLIIDSKFYFHCNSNKTFINWDKLKNEINFYDGQKIALIKTDTAKKYCYFGQTK